jgi:hypothetical protein
MNSSAPKGNTIYYPYSHLISEESFTQDSQPIPTDIELQQVHSSENLSTKQDENTQKKAYQPTFTDQGSLFPVYQGVPLTYIPGQGQYPTLVPIIPMMNTAPVLQNVIYDPQETQQRRGWSFETPECVKSIRKACSEITKYDIYKFLLNLLSIFAIIGIAVSVRFLFSYRYRAQALFALVLLGFAFGTFRKGVKVLSTGNETGIKNFVRASAEQVILSLWSYLMFIIVGGRRFAWWMLWFSGGFIHKWIGRWQRM